MSASSNQMKRKASSSSNGSSCHKRLLPEPPPIRDRPITFLDVFKREARYPIYDRFCSLLPIVDIISLSRTCKTFVNMHQNLVPGQWNVDRRLLRFVQSPRTFRSRMGQHDALISGSFALQFFERVLWKESDLDMFVQQGHGAEAFCRYLCMEEGYVLAKSQGREAYRIFDLVEVRTFNSRQGSPLSGGPTVVQIVITRGLPIQAILRGFYMTTVVNVITWNKAYAIFPLITFVRHKGYMLKPSHNYFATLQVKYAERGWRSQLVQWPAEAMSNSPIRSVRRVGDQYTWMIALDTNDIEQSKTPDLVIEYAAFGLSMQDNDNGIQHPYYLVTAPSFQSHALQYNYTYDGTSDWVYFLGRTLQNLIVARVRKMEPSARPPNFEEGVRNIASYRDTLGNLLANFHKPDKWTFWDEEIPRWYEVWRKAQRKAMDGLEGVVT